MSRVLRYNLCKYHFFRSYKILRSYCAHILPGGKRNDFMSSETRCAPARVQSIAWKVAAVVWALVIFYLSTGPFGPTFTKPLLAGALSLIHVTLPPPSFDVVHLCVRKAAHLAEYAILAVLLCASSEEEVAAGEFIPIGSGPRLCVSSEDVAAGLPRHISNDPNGQWRHKAAATPSSPWRPRRVLGCFLIALAYSLTDEYHQSFVPGRHPSLTDCGIDSIGAAMGILVYYVNHLRLRAVGLCGTDILPVSNHGQDGPATIPSGGERPPRQKVQSDPIPSLRRHEISGQND
jgi:VanZ family protein